MKKYNCTVYKVKERKIKDKVKYEVVSYDIYPDISKEMALYLAVRYGGGLSGFKGNEPCHPLKGDSVIGFHKWYNDIDMVYVAPVYTHISAEKRTDGFGGHALHPMVKHYSSVHDKALFSEKVKMLVDMFRGDVFADFSIEAHYIWAPRNLIPKGYKHVTSGEVKEGDYYFDSSYDHWYWLSVDLSYSGYKPGRMVENAGIKYVGVRHSHRKDGEVTRYYEPFLIRKIEQ